MRKFQRIGALILSAAMVLSLTACSGGSNVAKPTNDPSTTPAPSGQVTAKPMTKMTIGTWWLQYYDSSCTQLTDDPSFVAEFTEPSGWDKMTDEQKAEEVARHEHNVAVAQKKLDNVKKIEEKYGYKFYWENLTYTGILDSIENSIVAGIPDAQVYLTELTFGIPAQLNGYAADLRQYIPADHDIFTTQKHVKFLDLGDGKACIIQRVAAQTAVENTYPLAFNKQLLEEAGLEDPNNLYARGEWTWDKFEEYCDKLTKNTDDPENAQYGFSGFVEETLKQLLMSNGADFAATQTEGLTSAATGETLEFIVNLYKKYGNYDFVAEKPWDVMRFQYRDGNYGFFTAAAWIIDQNHDYNPGNDPTLSTLPFDIEFCPWPIGPSGNAETNGQKAAGGEFYIIPSTLDPKDIVTVFNMLCDYWNWYDNDYELRDNKMTMTWWYKSTAKDPDLQVHNFEVMKEMGAHEMNDLGFSIKMTYDFTSLLKEEVTVSEFQQSYKQELQDKINSFYGK